MKKSTTDYTKKIKSPIYEVKGDKPGIKELVDTQTVDKMFREIEESIVPIGVKIFLTIAATRHYKFNYGKIAEYYANSPPNVQDLFEKSGLVIIDFDNAIERGFVKMNKRLMDIRSETS